MVLIKASLLAWGLASLAAFPAAKAASASGVESLGWLSGCWRQDLPDGYFEEYWMAPVGKTLLHMGRMVSGNQTAFYETLQIREADGQLSLLVTINGKRQVRFEVVESRPRKVVFQTPAGVSWERLTYERPSDDELVARLEKKKDGKASEDEFRMKRVDCQKALAPGP